MDSSLLWIILGSLIGLVVVFLGVTVTLDRRKRRKLRAKEQAITSEALEAGKKVVLFLQLLVDHNATTLADFKPSIGPIKMADIKNRAKQALKDLKASREYALLITLDDPDSQAIITLIDELQQTSANSWTKTQLTARVHALAASVDAAPFGDYVQTARTSLDGLYQWTSPTA